MADTQEENISTTENIDEEGEKKSFQIQNLFQPKMLKKVFLFGSIAIVLIIIIIVLLSIIFGGRPSNLPYHYKDLPRIKFTSDDKPYGTFFGSVKIHLSYLPKSSGIVDEINTNPEKVVDAIIQILSKQNYFRINNIEKRQHNLTPALKQNLNLYFRTPGGIHDVIFEDFAIMLNKDNESIKNTYFELGRHEIDYIDSKAKRKYNYIIELYMVYDASSDQFNKVLNTNEKISELKRMAKNDLTDKSVFLKQINNLNNLQKYYNTDKLDLNIRSFFQQIESEVKKHNPYYEINNNRYKNIFFSLYIKNEINEN